MGRLKQTFAAILFGRGIMAARQLVAVPIMLNAWGGVYYGQWIMVSAIPTMLSLSNLGIGSSASAMIAINQAQDKNEISAEILATSWVMVIAVAFLVSGGVGLCTVFFKETNSHLPSGTLVIFILLASLFIKMSLQPLLGWWSGTGRLAGSLRMTNLNNLIETAILIAVPLLGGRALLLVSLSLVWNLVWSIYYLRSSVRSGMILWQSPSFRPTWTTGKSMLSSGIGHQINPLWQAIYFQGFTLISASLFGPIGAAAWGSLRVFTRAGNQLIEMISQSLTSEFQISYGKNDLKLCRAWHSVGVLISVALGITICISMVLFGKILFDIWSQGTFKIPWLTWAITCTCLIPYSFWAVSAELQRSANKPWSFSLWGVFAGITSLILVYFTSHYGFVSLAFGALFFETLMALFILPSARKLLGQSRIGVIMDGQAILRRQLIELKSILRRRNHQKKT